MRTVKVKICGITQLEDLRMVTEFGADAVGFIVGIPSSPRNLSLRTAETLIKHVPIFVKSVLVLVPQAIDEVVALHRTLRPDVLQIHGNNIDSPLLRETLPQTPIIRGLTADPSGAVEDTIVKSKGYDAILLDSYVPGKYGGTGLLHDWTISARLKQAIAPKPLILAGGLTSDNVQDAIRTVQPYAVDVSTGVEAHPRIKDPDKVFTFMHKVKTIQLSDDKGEVQ